MGFVHKKFDSIFIFISLIFFILGVYGKNFYEGIAAAGSFFLIYTLLWKDNEPPVLFFGIILQWIQVAIRFFDTSVLKIPMASVFQFNDNITSAYFASLIGLVVMSVGISYARRGAIVPTINEWRGYVQQLDYERFLYAFFYSIPISAVVWIFGRSIGGIQLFSTKLALLKWSFFFVFFLIANLINKGKTIFIVALVVQFVLSFTGFFSGFKDFFISVAICYSFLIVKLTWRQFLLFFAFSTIAIVFGIYWQSVKGDYRSFISGGEISQSSKVSQSESLNKLYELVSEVDAEKFEDGRDEFLSRLSYIEYFSATIKHIPEKAPFEDGKLIGEALLKIAMPRVLFKDKESIDDSKKTAKYTGLNITGAEKATSISLGYFAECYVDFGLYGMHVSLLFIGFLIGYIYQHVIDMVSSKLWGYAIAFSCFSSVYLFEKALDKFLPDQVAFFLVIYLLNRYYLDSFIKFLNK